MSTDGDHVADDATAVRGSRDGAAKTAFLTGATGGIGAAFARQLAARGYGLVLSDRDAAPLEELCAALRRDHGVATEPLVADLADPAATRACVDAIRERAPLDLLLHVAGFGTHGEFETHDLDRHLAMVGVHVSASVALTWAAVPAMIQRGRGAVILVGSLAAFMPFGGSATYSATKAFVVAFAELLHLELKGTGVCVQALCPGLTRTGFHHTEAFAEFDAARVPARLWNDPDRVVEASLRALERNQVICTPGWRNRWLRRIGASRTVRWLCRHTVQTRKPKTPTP